MHKRMFVDANGEQVNPNTYPTDKLTCLGCRNTGLWRLLASSWFCDGCKSAWQCWMLGTGSPPSRS